MHCNNNFSRKFWALFGTLFPDHQGIRITAVRITEGPQCTYQDLKTCIFIIISFYFEYSLINFLHDMYNKKNWFITAVSVKVRCISLF
jgi:hypothetical protein